MKSTVLAPGARSAAVKSLQHAVGGLPVDGFYGSSTDQAVRGLQKAHDLTPTGVVDEQTWDVLEEEKYPFLPYRTTVLKPGSSGPALEALQDHFDLPATDVYDAATTDAIKVLQSELGLTSTGYVGAVTWQALEEEVGSHR